MAKTLYENKPLTFVIKKRFKDTKPYNLSYKTRAFNKVIQQRIC